MAREKKGEDPIDYSQMDVSKLMGALGDVPNLIGEQVQGTLTTIFEGLKKGVMPKQAFHIPDGAVDSIYTQAYNMYNQGKYKEATYLFQILMLLDPGVSKHVMGCAACLHRQGLYDKAAQIYALCATLDVDNPMPHFHAADCYIKLQAPELAIVCLKSVISCAKEKEEHKVVKERAMMMLETVEAEVKARREGTSEVPSREEDPASPEPIA